MIDILNIVQIAHPEILTRIFVSVSLGFIIGVERELTNKSAGLRTHILVCLGSTVFTILSIYGFANILTPDGVRIVNDPARIAAQILTGIGFIGGGAVLHHGVNVYGLTTAASLWITASIGMAAGTGYFSLAFFATIVAFLILVLVRKLEKLFLEQHILKGARIKAVVICTPEFVAEIQDWFCHEFENIIEMSNKKSLREDDMIKLTFVIDLFDNDPINKTYKKIREIQNIESLTLQQVFEEN